MRLIWEDLEVGRTRIAIQPSTDGEIVGRRAELIFDARLDARSPDRMWAAAALAFGRHIEGVWEGDFSVSPAVANSIRNAVEVSDTFFPPISGDVAQVYSTGGTLYLITDHEPKAYQDSLRLSPNQMILQILRLGDWTGRLFSMGHYKLASNAYAMHGISPEQPNYGPYLSIAALLADELSCNTIILPPEADTWAGINAAAQVCASVGLRLCSFEEHNQLATGDGSSGV